MDYSTRLKNDIKSQRRREIRLEARTNKQLDKFCDGYHSWIADERKAKRAPKTILAEGDSWFRYPAGLGVISQLENLLGIEILNLASPGDETGDMLSIRQKRRLIRELKHGPARRMKYDYLLFSGGGNDLVGIDRFHKWLNPYVKGMTASQVINPKALKVAFGMLELNYNELIELRDKHSPATKLVFHSYDLAIPDGRGVCGKGPWMKPGLVERKVPAKLRREVVAVFLKEFDNLLRKIAVKHKGIIVIKTQGTLIDSEWANELHPRNKGFKKIAKLFAAAL
jgi:hypothetical protein